MKIRTIDGKILTVTLYEEDAPNTCKIFLSKLPIKIKLYHARIAGEEIFTEEGPLLNIPIENATNELEPGEIGAFAWSPRSSNDFKGGIVITYGPHANLIKCSNVFARVAEEDMETLKAVSLRMWKGGSEEFEFFMG